MAKDVKCMVNNCKYYKTGDACNAAIIEVCTETRNCGCSAETNCKTFMAK